MGDGRWEMGDGGWSGGLEAWSVLRPWLRQGIGVIEQAWRGFGRASNIALSFKLLI